MKLKILKGTLISAISFFFIGGLIYGVLLSDFVAANSDPNAIRPMDEIVLWTTILTNLTVGLFFTLFLHWSGAKKVIDGLKTGALFSLMLTVCMDFSVYSMSTLFSLTYLILDLIIMTLLGALVGLIVVLTWGKEKKT